MQKRLGHRLQIAEERLWSTLVESWGAPTIKWMMTRLAGVNAWMSGGTR